jgi:CHAT domain-containing protein
VAELVHGTLLLGPEATRAAVEAHVQGSRFVYLAAHGVADASNPLRGSYVVLADGRWTANEIQYTPEFRNTLVVLSACQTGLGKVSDAGVLGIARAFQISGANVVMSLWSIDDGATADLMADFVRGLEFETRADALREAMILTREKYPDPSKWGSFAVFGSPF